MAFSKFQRFFHYDREKYENFLEDETSKIWKLGNFILDFLVIISIFIIILESINVYHLAYKSEIFVVNFIISTIFLFDYIYRFFKSVDKKHFFTSTLNFIDLLSFLPFFLSIAFKFFFNLEFLVVLRVTRVFRVLRLLRNIPITVWFVHALKNYKDEYKAIFLLFWIIIFVVSTLVFEVETAVNPEFSSIWKALWWGVVTAATVWYWDMIPITPTWRIIGTVVILLWPALFAIIWSITILVFTEVAHTQDKIKKWKVKICLYCERENELDANYCINCWKKYRLKKREDFVGII
jgi:voltage-gated potassium channel